jgi:plasmid segregation protein ParM
MYIEEVVQMQIVPIDTGRNTIKLINKKQFRSVVGDWQKRNLSNDGDYTVEINNEKFFVGNLALTESISPREMTTESKIHSETKTLFLTALGLTTTEEKPFIITGVPITQFNQETKENLEKLLCGNYTIKINDFPTKYVSINNITIAPEGGASFWYALSKNPLLQYGKKRIIDLGSRTINYATINDKQYINKDSGTLSYGCLKLKDDKITPEQLASKIVADLSQKWMEYNSDKDMILLTGGGTLILGKILKTYFKNCETIDDPVFSNVQGYYKMGVEKWAKQTVVR